MANWFEEINSVKKVFLAISHDIPVINEKYNCYKIDFVNGNPKLTSCITSTITGINYFGNNIYQIRTQNNVYIVCVG